LICILIYVFLVVSPSYLYVLYLFVLYVKIMCFSLNHMSKGMRHKKLSVFNKHTAVTVIMEINILILIILLYILKPEWESSLPYALCNLNLCFVLFLWGYKYSQGWVGMLCATLPYALCNYLWVYILMPEWECSLPYALCNLNLCFVLIFVGLYLFSRL